MIVGADGLGWLAPQRWLAAVYADVLRDDGWRVATFAGGREAAASRPDVAMVFGIDRLGEWARTLEEYGWASPVVGVPLHARYGWRDRRSRPGASALRRAYCGLARCAAVVYVAEAERQAVSDDFGSAPAGEIVHLDARRVPNAATHALDASGGSTVTLAPPRDIDVVIAGTVEAGNNPLLIAQALADRPLRALFVGPLSTRGKAYNRRFLHLVRGTENLAFLGSPEQVDEARLFRRAHVVASASVVEALPAALLQGARHGCSVVWSTCSYADEFIGGRLRVEVDDEPIARIDPRGDAGAAADILTRAVAAHRFAEDPNCGDEPAQRPDDGLVRAVAQAVAA
jgi:glycosyltransferase involved in cell wall biosynthesis